MKKKSRGVSVCPVCNSRDVELDDMLKFYQSVGIFRHRCNNCGYTGLMTVMEKERAGRLKVLKKGRQ